MENYTGEQIKSYRNKLGLTQAQLAELVGVSNKAISKWETGEGLPDIENIKRLASLFHISIDQLLEETDRPKLKINTVCVGFGVATLFIYLLPFISLSFDAFGSSTFYIVNNGYQLMGQVLNNGQLGNFLISISLLCILASNIAFSFPQMSSFGTPFIKRLSLISWVGALFVMIFLIASVSQSDGITVSSIQIGSIVLFISQSVYCFYFYKRQFSL